MDPPAKRKNASKKMKANKTKPERTTKSKIELCEPKIENLLTMSTMIVEQRRSAKIKKGKYTEVSSGEEYQNEDTDDEYDEDNDDDDEVEPKNRRSTAAKRKSMAILSKGETESWGDFRNTIDNGPIPSHALTLNETAFNVALKLQHQIQDRRLCIQYLDDDNQFEIINDAKMTEQLLSDTYRVHLSPTDNNSPLVVPPFESAVHKTNAFTLNIGIGPIQALDWLSMPTSACPISEQYLAIGCSRSSIISRHFYDEIYSYSNYVQIWMFNLSDLKTNPTPTHHQLVCFIPLVDSGAIWCLKWSPACSAPSAYLAAGASSGSIYLFKLLPHPIQTRSSTNHSYPFYRSSKSIRLMLNEPNNHTQCLAIDWSTHDPNRLVASYSNGFIALFNVNIKAIHLTQIKPTNHEKIIAPIRLVRVAHTPIRDVKFLNWSANLILTVANISKRFSVWDLDDSHQHLIDIENSGTESVVRSLTGDLLCAKEFTPSFARTSAYLAYDLENSNLPKHIYFQSTPDHVLSIDYSPWLDAALLCDSNGQVYFFRLTNFVRWTRKNECSLKYRLKLFNLNAMKKSDYQQASASETNGDDGESSFEQSSYSDLIDKYLLDTNVCCDQKFVSKQDDFSKAGNHSLNALHKIRFNPNLSSYGWYALGGESGLLFVLPINQAWSVHAVSQYEYENSSNI